jgi:hypothetical protein
LNTAADLMIEADRTGDPRARIELLEEAARLADAANDDETAFEAREGIVDTAVFAGQAERALVAFAWCLAAFDREPERFADNEYNIFWGYTRVLRSLHDLPGIPFERIEDLQRDFEARISRSQYNPRITLYTRFRWALHRGLVSQARAAWRDMKREQRDELAICPTCEANDEINLLRQEGALETLVDKAEAIFRKPRCLREPQTTLAAMLEVLMRLGRVEEAAGFHERGYRLVKSDPEFLTQQGQHIAFLGLTHNFRAARRAFERHSPWALETKELGDRFSFMLHSLTWLRLEKTASKSFNLNVPEGHPAHSASLEALSTWVQTDLEGLANAFDARNRTTAFTDRMRAATDLPDFARPHSLTRKAAFQKTP